MSTPLVVLACILAFFALVLIPLMMMKGDRKNKDRQHPHERQATKPHKKKKKR